MNIQSVSVIIPALVADRTTAITIEHLLVQNTENLKLEIVVVSPDPCPSPFRQSVRWEVLKQEPSAANARNRGMSIATGDLLVFLDADMIVDPSFIVDHVRIHESGSSPVLFRGRRLQVPGNEIGRIGFHKPPRRLEIARATSYLSRFEKEAARFLLRPDRATNQTAWIYCITANLSILKKCSLERELHFDTRFQTAGCEDTDFAFRAHQAGIPMRMAESACGYHIQSYGEKKRDPGDLRDNILRFRQKYAGEAVVQSTTRRMLGLVERGEYQDYLYGDAGGD